MCDSQIASADAANIERAVMSPSAVGTLYLVEKKKPENELQAPLPLVDELPE